MRPLNHAHGMEVFLYLNHILFRDHEKYVKSISLRLKDASTAAVREQELPVEYLWRGATDKDRTARRIAAERGSRKAMCAF